ncbi:hypothetical protein QNO21_02995 [Microbacterium sp. zg-Y818]|uniref:lipopolysaccharide biosynthesis protein n=1 Tax=unclassified Microbacterium TaxID=2609290 RepID=UPI00214C9167|nr:MULTISPECIES: hypothetical protein [unclassified Microbacterium]MCR2801712.1 hypothetical protein [Microbacterium sp. zg.Y818]WIM23021.1 hypothetical protein QNO21_02995 [Microbacterium sp. zg-Y818]
MSARPLVGVLGRISGFSLSVGAGSLLGILALPVLMVALGPETWGILVVVQTVGQLGGVLVAFGWGATGAAMVASAPEADRPNLYRESLRVRLQLYAAAVPLAAVVLLLLTRGDVVTSLLGAVVYLLPYLGATWFFTGQARPLRLFLCDTVPTMAGTIVGVGAALLTGQLWAFLVGQGLGFLVAVSIDAVVAGRGATPQPQRRPLRLVLGEQRHAVVATATSTLYVSLPIVAVQVFLPALVPLYGMADRLFKYSSIAFLPIQQFFQGWVPDPDADLARRAKAAALASAVIALIGGGLIAGLSPLASVLLSAGKLEVPWQLSLPLGVAFVGVGVSAVVGYACLVAVGRVRSLAVSTLIGAGVGAPMILVFAASGSVSLVAWSVAVSELCVAGYQVSVLWRELRMRGGGRG